MVQRTLSSTIYTCRSISSAVNIIMYIVYMYFCVCIIYTVHVHRLAHTELKIGGATVTGNFASSIYKIPARLHPVQLVCMHPCIVHVCDNCTSLSFYGANVSALLCRPLPSLAPPAGTHDHHLVPRPPLTPQATPHGMSFSQPHPHMHEQMQPQQFPGKGEGYLHVHVP